MAFDFGISGIQGLDVWEAGIKREMFGFGESDIPLYRLHGVCEGFA